MTSADQLDNGEARNRPGDQDVANSVTPCDLADRALTAAERMLGKVDTAHHIISVYRVVVAITLIASLLSALLIAFFCRNERVLAIGLSLSVLVLGLVLVTLITEWIIRPLRRAAARDEEVIDKIAEHVRDLVPVMRAGEIPPESVQLLTRIRVSRFRIG